MRQLAHHPLLISFMSMLILIPPHTTIAAKTETTENAEMLATAQLQLHAVSSYIERTFLPTPTSLTTTELRNTVELGTHWLIETQEESGHFRYEYAPYTDTDLEGDNSVRQAGALFELGEVARRDPTHSLGTSAAIQKAITYFTTLSRTDTYADTTFRCVTQNEVSNRCKLGTTALALTGILGYLETHPHQRAHYETLVNNYLAFILAMKKDGAGFRNQYHIGSAPQTSEESPFFNGEALLALVRYYQFHPTPDVRAVIDETVTYLMDEPYHTALYLWIMAALKDLHALSPSDRYVTYAEAFTTWRRDTVRRFRSTTKNLCAYTEGIVSAYSILETQLPATELDTLRSEIYFWLAKNKRLQITSRDRFRVLPVDTGLTLKKLGDPERAYGGFLTSEEHPTLRIDFTQHCISAYLQTLTDIERNPIL